MGEVGLTLPKLEKKHFETIFFISIFLCMGISGYLLTPINDFWIDESFSYFHSQKDISTLLFEPQDVHPPLHYIISHYWLILFDNPRLLSVVIGIFSVMVLFLVTLEYTERKEAGFISILLYSVSWSITYYTAEFRMYPLVYLFTLFSWLYFFRWWKNCNIWNLIIMYCFLVLNLLTHYFTFWLWFVFAIFIFLSDKKRFWDFTIIATKKSNIWQILSFYGLGAIFSYVIWYFIIQLEVMNKMWLKNPTFLSHISSLVNYFVKPVNMHGKGFILGLKYLAFVILIYGLMCLFLKKWKIKQDIYLFCLAIFSPVVFIIIGLKTNTYHHRYTIMYGLILYVLMGKYFYKVIELGKKWKNRIFFLIGVFMVFMLMFTSEGVNDSDTELRTIGGYFINLDKDVVIIHETLQSMLPEMYYYPYAKHYIYGLTYDYLITAGATATNKSQYLANRGEICDNYYFDWMFKDEIYFLQSEENYFNGYRKIEMKLDGINIYRLDLENYCEGYNAIRHS